MQSANKEVVHYYPIWKQLHAIFILENIPAQNHQAFKIFIRILFRLSLHSFIFSSAAACFATIITWNCMTDISRLFKQLGFCSRTGDVPRKI